MDHVARLRLVAIGSDAHAQHARRGGDRQLDVADLVPRDGVGRRRRPVHDDRDEDVRHRRIGDRDAQALAVRRELANLARLDLAALDRDESLRAGEGRGHEHVGGVADLVALLVRDELDRVVVGDLPERSRGAPDPEERGGARGSAPRVGRFRDKAERARLRRLVEHGAFALRVRASGQRCHERVLHVAAVAPSATREQLLCRDPLTVEHADGDRAIGEQLPVGVDGDKVDACVRAFVRDVLRRVDARVERGRMHRDRGAARNGLAILVLHRCRERELLRAFGRRERRGDAEGRDAALIGLRCALRAERIAGDERLGVVEIVE